MREKASRPTKHQNITDSAKELPAVGQSPPGWEGTLRRAAYPAAPPDYDQRHNQYGNQRLQGWRWSWRHAKPTRRWPGAQLRQQQLHHASRQRLAQNRGDVQGGGESDRDTV